MLRNRVANLSGEIIGTSINVSSITLTSGINVIAQIDSANSLANAAYNQANNAYSQANAAYGAANVVFTTLNLTSNAQNTAITNAHNQANLAYAQANTASLKKLNIITRSNVISINLTSNATFNVVGRSSNTSISAVF